MRILPTLIVSAVFLLSLAGCTAGSKPAAAPAATTPAPLGPVPIPNCPLITFTGSPAAPDVVTLTCADGTQVVSHAPFTSPRGAISPGNLIVSNIVFVPRDRKYGEIRFIVTKAGICQAIIEGTAPESPLILAACS